MEGSDVEKTLARLQFGAIVLMTSAVAAGLGIGWVYRNAFPPEVPLFYSRPWGADQLTNPKMLLLPIGLALGVGLLTLVMSKRLMKEPLLGIITTTSGVIIQVVLLLGVLRIVLLVT